MQRCLSWLVLRGCWLLRRLIGGQWRLVLMRGVFLVRLVWLVSSYFNHFFVSKLSMRIMGDPTLLGPKRARILGLLLAQTRTAKETAESLKIQVSAARKHLERLRELGLVDEQFQKAEMGRPKKLYALTEKGKELFPRQYDLLLNETLAQLAKD